MERWVCWVNIERINEILHVCLWVMIFLNAWCVWRNYRAKKAYDKECERLREVSNAFDEAARAYQEAYDKLMEIRERVLSDDRAEDESQEREAD